MRHYQEISSNSKDNNKIGAAIADIGANHC